MKSFNLVLLSSLAAVASALPDHVQSVPSLLCIDAPTQTTTVTIIKAAAPITITAAAKLVSTSSSITPTKPTSFSTTTITNTVATVPRPKRTIDVLVGAFALGNGTNDFRFKPNNITANLGDVVRFNMLEKAHSVTQSQFARPCIKNGTFDTQLQDSPLNKTGAIFEYFAVNVTTPLWFYCQQTAAMQEFINLAEVQNGTFKAIVSGSSTRTTSDVSTTVAKAPIMTATPTLHSTFLTAIIKIVIPTPSSTTHSTTAPGTVKSSTPTPTLTTTSTSMAPAVMSTGMIRVPIIKGRSVKPS